ncbi:MAG: hypothetical protein KZQ64_00375 [gamma proteobacterium symbiont of Bathyaustriella thionipta]|nr:hypothetical protein [gamma proteobacterium symbiont of Bathyaustriella thionipta]MCU7950363.1 hypothetical protein [gamma proteobacterium symbiont of Bathyaustriella thionipta]MCU7951863.1 hypothetical protein [gamma proteobacterium symbiont of Bathyaustriella thionipta]MCU7956113.1 hypothetical protein [gamma proteobacterium symbiont of Bathyaustriella thionipta]MCU7966472.1 hypothetical protein [gamma proteobacterium symbiont of Bathyaustriella thionipta]
MKKFIQLQISNKAYDNLKKMSKELGIHSNDFASLCFEYVDIKHRGITEAARKIRDLKNKESFDKKNLSQHLKQLSAEQIELLLNKAAQKKKN